MALADSVWKEQHNCALLGQRGQQNTHNFKHKQPPGQQPGQTGAHCACCDCDDVTDASNLQPPLANSSSNTSSNFNFNFNSNETTPLGGLDGSSLASLGAGFSWVASPFLMRGRLSANTITLDYDHYAYSDDSFDYDGHGDDGGRNLDRKLGRNRNRKRRRHRLAVHHTFRTASLSRYVLCTIGGADMPTCSTTVIRRNLPVCLLARLDSCARACRAAPQVRTDRNRP
jgi:hypothetical protein